MCPVWESVWGLWAIHTHPFTPCWFSSGRPRAATRGHSFWNWIYITINYGVNRISKERGGFLYRVIVVYNVVISMTKYEQAKKLFSSGSVSAQNGFVRIIYAVNGELCRCFSKAPSVPVDVPMEPFLDFISGVNTIGIKAIGNRWEFSLSFDNDDSQGLSFNPTVEAINDHSDLYNTLSETDGFMVKKQRKVPRIHKFQKWDKVQNEMEYVIPKLAAKGMWERYAPVESPEVAFFTWELAATSKEITVFIPKEITLHLIKAITISDGISFTFNSKKYASNLEINIIIDDPYEWI